jgi:hypothetical protein
MYNAILILIFSGNQFFEVFSKVQSTQFREAVWNYYGPMVLKEPLKPPNKLYHILLACGKETIRVLHGIKPR